MRRLSRLFARSRIFLLFMRILQLFLIHIRNCLLMNLVSAEVSRALRRRYLASISALEIRRPVPILASSISALILSGSMVVISFSLFNCMENWFS